MRYSSSAPVGNRSDTPACGVPHCSHDGLLRGEPLRPMEAALAELKPSLVIHGQRRTDLMGAGNAG